MAAPAYTPAGTSGAFQLEGDDDDNLDLGIPPVSPTATVPVTSLATPDSVPTAKSNQSVPPHLAASPHGLGANVAGAGASPTPRSPAATVAVSGNIDSKPGTTGGSRPYGPAAGVGPSSTGTGFVTDTLDEPVTTTLLRDLKAIWFKLRQVLLPYGQKEVLNDWDLWGPLVFCLLLAIILSTITSTDQSSVVFTGIFVIVWVGAAVVTLNSKLLGGKVSFFQSVCVLGYCIFPLTVASFLSVFFKAVFLLRLIFCVVGFAWATYASIGFLSSRHLDDRRTLAVYPILLFYFAVGWIVLVA